MNIIITPATDYVENDEQMIYVKKPEQYGDYPVLRDVVGLDKLTSQEIEDYFKYILTDGMRVSHINPCDLRDMCLCCDKCGVDLENAPCHHDKYDFLCVNCIKYVSSNAKYTFYESLKHPYDVLDYGSMFDWVPLYQDKEGNMIFKNLNMASIYYQQLSIMALDNHSRGGFYRLATDLETLLVDLEELYAWKLEETEDDEYRAQPIHELLMGFGIHPYYG